MIACGSSDVDGVVVGAAWLVCSFVDCVDAPVVHARSERRMSIGMVMRRMIFPVIGQVICRNRRRSGAAAVGVVGWLHGTLACAV